MKLIQLTTEERLATGFTHKAILTYTDVETYATGSAGSQTATVPIFPLPATAGGAAVASATGAQYLVQATFYRVRTTFAGVTTLTLAVTDGTTTYLAAGVVVAGSQVANKVGATAGTFTAATLSALFTNATGGEVLSSLTAGAVDVYFKIVPISDLDRNI